jgi:hypothetical protein
MTPIGAEFALEFCAPHRLVVIQKNTSIIERGKNPIDRACTTVSAHEAQKATSLNMRPREVVLYLRRDHSRVRARESGIDNHEKMVNAGIRDGGARDVDPPSRARREFRILA